MPSAPVVTWAASDLQPAKQIIATLLVYFPQFFKHSVNVYELSLQWYVIKYGRIILQSRNREWQQMAQRKKQPVLLTGIWNAAVANPIQVCIRCSTSPRQAQRAIHQLRLNRQTAYQAFTGRITSPLFRHCGSGEETDEHYFYHAQRGQQIVFRDYMDLVEFLISLEHLPPHIDGWWWWRQQQVHIIQFHAKLPIDASHQIHQHNVQLAVYSKFAKSANTRDNEDDISCTQTFRYWGTVSEYFLNGTNILTKRFITQNGRGIRNGFSQQWQLGHLSH